MMTTATKRIFFNATLGVLVCAIGLLIPISEALASEDYTLNVSVAVPEKKDTGILEGIGEFLSGALHRWEVSLAKLGGSQLASALVPFLDTALPNPPGPIPGAPSVGMTGGTTGATTGGGGGGSTGGGGGGGTSGGGTTSGSTGSAGTTGSATTGGGGGGSVVTQPAPAPAATGGTTAPRRLTPAEIGLTRALEKGISGDDVKILQNLIAKDLGLSPSDIATGYFGPMTDAAIRAFKKKYSIVETTGGEGVAGPQTLAKAAELASLAQATSGGGSATTLAPVLRIGARIAASDAVKVRSAPLGAELALEGRGASGEIVGGPETAGGYTWWKIRYASGKEGWTAANWIAAVAITPVTPVPASSAATAPAASGSSLLLSRRLLAGSNGEDVRMLQKFLNRDPATRISESGIGSPGNETTYFGLLTAKAVERFQAKYGIASGGTPDTTGYGAVGPATRAKMQSLAQ